MGRSRSLEVDWDVNEGYVARAHEGMRAEITLDAIPETDIPAGGRRSCRPPTARSDGAVKVTFDSLDARVLPEMGAKVTFWRTRPPQVRGRLGRLGGWRPPR